VDIENAEDVRSLPASVPTARRQADRSPAKPPVAEILCRCSIDGQIAGYQRSALKLSSSQESYLAVRCGKRAWRRVDRTFFTQPARTDPNANLALPD